MPHVDALLSTHALLLRSITQLNADVCVHQLKTVVVDSCSTPTVVHVLQIQMLVVYPDCTSSTLKHATVNACKQLNAFAVLLSKTPHVLAVKEELASLLRYSILTLVSADALRHNSVVVDSYSITTPALVSSTQLQDVSLPSTPSTIKVVIVCAEPNSNVSVALDQTTPPVLVLNSQLVMQANHTTLSLVSANATTSCLVVVDRFGITTPVRASVISTPDVCPTCIDSIDRDVTVFAFNNNNASVELNQ